MIVGLETKQHRENEIMSYVILKPTLFFSIYKQIKKKIHLVTITLKT